MSSIHFSNHSQHKIDLDSFKPLTPATVGTLAKYVFHVPELKTGFNDLQSLSIEVASLKQLQQDFDEKKIDLGWKDKTIAVLKCIGTALLVAAAVAASFFLLSTFGLIGGYGASLFLLPSGLSILLFALTCAQASEVFSRPTPQQLQNRLGELAETELRDVEALRCNKDTLEYMMTELAEQIKIAGHNKATEYEKELKDTYNLLARADKDICRMLNSVGYSATPFKEEEKAIVDLTDIIFAPNNDSTSPSSQESEDVLGSPAQTETRIPEEIQSFLEKERQLAPGEEQAREIFSSEGRADQIMYIPYEGKTYCFRLIHEPSPTSEKHYYIILPEECTNGLDIPFDKLLGNPFPFSAGAEEIFIGWGAYEGESLFDCAKPFECLALLSQEKPNEKNYLVSAAPSSL